MFTNNLSFLSGRLHAVNNVHALCKWDSNYTRSFVILLYR